MNSPIFIRDGREGAISIGIAQEGRARRMPYVCNSAIGWYVWKSVPYGLHVKTRTVDVEE